MENDIKKKKFLVNLIISIMTFIGVILLDRFYLIKLHDKEIKWMKDM